MNSDLSDCSCLPSVPDFPIRVYPIFNIWSNIGHCQLSKLGNPICPQTAQTWLTFMTVLPEVYRTESDFQHHQPRVTEAMTSTYRSTCYRCYQHPANFTATRGPIVWRLRLSLHIPYSDLINVRQIEPRISLLSFIYRSWGTIRCGTVNDIGV